MWIILCPIRVSRLKLLDILYQEALGGLSNQASINSEKQVLFAVPYFLKIFAENLSSCSFVKVEAKIRQLFFITNYNNITVEKAKGATRFEMQNISSNEQYWLWIWENLNIET